MIMEPRTKIPDLWLEQYLLGELPAEKAAQIAALEQSDPDVRARIEALRSSNADILRDYPPRAIAARVAQHGAGNRHPVVRIGRLVPIAASALVAIAVVLWVTHGGGKRPPAPRESSGPRPQGISRMVDPGTRLKGEPALLLYRVAGSLGEALDRADAAADSAPGDPASEAEPLVDGSIAATGDMIQIKYRASGAPFGMILSIDGRGTVTLHHPVFEKDDTRLTAGPATALSRSYELDDALAFERFFLVTSDKPVPVSEVLAVARTLGADPLRPLPLPVGLAQKSVLIRKEGKVRR